MAVHVIKINHIHLEISHLNQKKNSFTYFFSTCFSGFLSDLLYLGHVIKMLYLFFVWDDAMFKEVKIKICCGMLV